MENIIAALTALVNTATVIRTVETPNKTWYLNNLNRIAVSLTDMLRDEVVDKILGVVPDPLDFSQEEKELILDKQWIAAIKSHRLRTGLGLKESKERMDKYRDANMKQDSYGSYHRI